MKMMMMITIVSIGLLFHLVHQTTKETSQ